MRRHFLWFSALLLVACSGTPGTSPGASSGAASSGGPDAAAPDSSIPRVAYKSYVTLGDSISDRGGIAPFFYDLLAENDNDSYPEYSGKDFKSVYDAGLKVHKRAVSGSVSSGLLRQIEGIPDDIVAPVVVTITIGGNDFRAALVRILQGQDAADRMAFRTNLTAAYAALKKKVPGARVFQATIYDPSDGTGDLARCPSPLNLIPKQDTTPFFKAWNQIVSEVTSEAGASVVDAYASFNGHGLVPPAENWFAADCIHPSRIGHNEMRKLFFGKITAP